MKHFTFQDNSKHPLDLSRDVSFSFFLAEQYGSGGHLALDLQNLTNTFGFPNFERVYSRSEEASDKSFDISFDKSLNEGINFSLYHDSPPLNHMTMELPQFNLVFNAISEHFNDNHVDNMFFIAVNRGLVVSKRPLHELASLPKEQGECLADLNLLQIKDLDAVENYEMRLDGVQTKSAVHSYAEAEDRFFADFLESLSLVFIQILNSLSELEPWRHLQIPIYAAIEGDISFSLRRVMVGLELIHILLCSIYHGTEIDGDIEESPWIFTLIQIVSSTEFFTNFPFLLTPYSPRVTFGAGLEILNETQAVIKFLALGKPTDFKLTFQRKTMSCIFLLHKEVIQQSPFFLGVSSDKYGWGESSLSLNCSKFSSFAFTLALNFMYFNALPDLTIKETIDAYAVANFLSLKELEEICTRRLYTLMHGLVCESLCCRANLHMVLAHALDFNLPKLLAACYKLLYNQKELWIGAAFNKLPESVITVLLEMAISSLTPQTAVPALITYHLLNQKLKRKTPATVEKAMELSQSIFAVCLQAVVSNLASYLEDKSKDFMLLLSGAAWSSDLIEMVFDFLAASLTYSNALESWVQIYWLLESQTRLGSKGLPLDTYDITASKDIVTKYFEKIGLFIKKNSLGIAIDGGFSSLSPQELAVIKQELGLDPDILEAESGPKEHISPFINGKSTRGIQFRHMGSPKQPLNTPGISKHQLASSSAPRKAFNSRRQAFEVGSRVKLLSPLRYGTIRYVGTLSFVSGTWYGIELDNPDGKSDGLLQGIRYFQTQSMHALFVKKEKLNLA
ncbi:hypothetical protein DSO57_1036440 [Entomophthora muscae]|uniref:Uncharacterized protein n=1 Tax=Entomophthora muscae TaxID=34485 RepID=A0ACC2SCC4_9FUNG|nr:hypothetical protein DSO57_1036440 [Entomophthora muscae]